MSVQAVRRALETAVGTISPSLPTAYENKPYTPTVGTAFQRVAVRFSMPRTMEMSGRLHEERGFLQITLFYPEKAGPGAAEARADLIRGTFYMGNSFTAAGITVFVESMPEVAPPLPEADWHVVPVRVPFYSFIRRS